MTLKITKKQIKIPQITGSCTTEVVRIAENRTFRTRKKIKTYEIRSAQDEYSADKQLKQLKGKMQNHGIQDSTNEDNDEDE